MNEIFGERQKATSEMRNRAKELENQARGWRALADAIDAIERSAIKSQRDGSDAEHPYIGVGSAAEQLLWSLATGCVK